MGDVPSPDAPWNQIAAYGMTYNAYERWIADLGSLSDLLRPIHDEFERTGVLPSNLGEDLLRAWLFVLIRQSRFVGVINDSGVVVDDYRSPAIQRILRRLNELNQVAESTFRSQEVSGD